MTRGRGEKSSRDTGLISGCSGYAPDPVFQIAGKYDRPRNDSETAVDSFYREPRGLGRTSGLPGSNARLEQFQNTSSVDRQRRCPADEHSDECGILQGEST